MEIVKFKKGKSNIYELELSNGLKFKLYDDVIVKFNLLVNKRFDDKKFEEIVNYNDSLGAYYETIKKLNTKMRSEVEIKDLLKRKDYSDNIINDTINRLKKDGYLNREVYIKSYISDAYRFSNDGPDKIRRNLNKLGFNDEEIDEFLTLDFTDKVNKIIDKKVKANSKYSTYLLKQHLNNYLINLGYPRELFLDYLNKISTNEKDILRKEANVLLKKYSKKYESNELKYFVKDKLYKKGYNSEEISEVLNESIL